MSTEAKEHRQEHRQEHRHEQRQDGRQEQRQEHIQETIQEHTQECTQDRQTWGQTIVGDESAEKSTDECQTKQGKDMNEQSVEMRRRQTATCFFGENLLKFSLATII